MVSTEHIANSHGGEDIAPRCVHSLTDSQRRIHGQRPDVAAGPGILQISRAAEMAVDAGRDFGGEPRSVADENGIRCPPISLA